MASIADSLRIAPEFRSDEHDDVRERIMPKLASRLKRFDGDAVELEVSVKDRDTPQQKVTLEAWLATHGSSHFVATEEGGDVHVALTQVRDEVLRQIDTFLSKRQQAGRG